MDKLAEKLMSYFSAFIINKIKTTKTFRDFQRLWRRDNYAVKVRDMFKAAVDDTKEFLYLPDQLIEDLLNDPTNRDEIFRWIVEGVTLEDFKSDNLNLQPYYENYREYQDKILPFFRIILNKVNEYKEANWDPEFLQILNKLNNLTRKIDKIDQQQKEVLKLTQQSLQLHKDTHQILNALLAPAGFDDLNELISEERFKTARERAIERLNKPQVTKKEILELNTIIALTYINNNDHQMAISHLNTAITVCEDKARKKRLKAMIQMLEGKINEAYENIMEAIQLEGYQKGNIEILINILLKQGKHEEAIKLLTETIEEDFPFLLAQVLLVAEKYEEALDLVESQLYQKPDDHKWLKLKAEILVLRMEEKILKNIPVNPMEIYDKVMPIIQRIEEKVIENEQDNIRIKELKAALFFRTERYSEAMLLYEEVYKYHGNSYTSYFYNLTYACVLAGAWEKAIELLQRRLEEKSDKKDIYLLAKVYIDSSQYEKAVELLERYSTLLNVGGSESIYYYWFYIEAQFYLLNYKEIEELLAELEEKSWDIAVINAIKAIYFNLLNDWENAIYYWESCLDKLESEIQTKAKIQLINAYQSRGKKDDFKKLKTLIETIPNWFQDKSLLNRYAKALFELGYYDKVLSLWNEYPFGQNEYLMRLITEVYYRLQWFELAKENYLRLYHETRGDIKYLLRYANCLFQLGDIKGCLQYLKNAESIVEEKGTIEDYSLLALAYMDAMEYEKALEYAYKTYILGKENPEVCRFYFGQFLRLHKFIEHPEPRWVEAYHEIFNNFNKKFPDEEPLYQELKALNEDGSLSEELIEMLKRSSNYYEDAEKLHQQFRMPVSFLVSFLQKGPLETWTHIMNGIHLNTWILDGNQQGIEEGIELVCNSIDVMCDIPTLLTVQELGLLENIKSCFNLYISQEQFNKLMEEYMKLKLLCKTGIKTIRYSNDKQRLIMEETTSEEVKKVFEKYETFINWINENCKKVGNLITSYNDNDDKEKFYNEQRFLFEPVKLCVDRNYSLFMDSLTIKSIAKEIGEIQVFNTYHFLQWLLLKKEISSEKYFECIKKLIAMGYMLIPINVDLYTHYIEKNNYKLTKELEILFDYMKHNEFNPDYLVKISSEILKWIWTSEMDKVSREYFTDYICTVLTFKRNKRKVIGKLFKESRDSFSFLIEHQWLKMKNCIEQWLKAQPII